ncbi:hypothetical protein NQ317_006605 [Molorchus minor]|uniref:Uncharacterized protein n=1 Tax=Molorchus minor TaxID=1323400 RepID=A0ABQ9JYW6_9CUCU|nr:hypothetical protein NQ317_006605 [Molorchus minor]
MWMQHDGAPPHYAVQESASSVINVMTQPAFANMGKKDYLGVLNCSNPNDLMIPKEYIQPPYGDASH